jgi:hypothetical protein
MNWMKVPLSQGLTGIDPDRFRRYLKSVARQLTRFARGRYGRVGKIDLLRESEMVE